MNIQTKTLAIILAAFFALTVLLSLTLKSIITDSYLQLEQSDLYDHLERSLNIIKLEQDNLQQFTTDWAVWDDSYQFILNQNEEYRKSNLVDSTFTDSNLAFIAYINRAGEIIYSRAFDLEKEEQIPIPGNILSMLQKGNKLLQPQVTDESISGLISLPESNYLI